MSARVYYAIGDIHGEAALLHELLGHIEEDATRRGVTPTLVLLGDLIDRGPDSRGVVAYAMMLQQSAGAIVLKGNHEEMLLNAYDSASMNNYATWSLNGGDGALTSYERINGEHANWRDAIDTDHIKWLRQLPSIWRDETRKLVFVHAGIDPSRFPNCPEGVRLWTRSDSFFNILTWPEDDELDGLLVVHGHTPTDDFEPEETARRINVDTGAVFGGPLTCVVLAPDEAPRFLFARRR